MYCARPSRRSPWPRRDGRGARELKTAWHDGTRELVFEPLEFLERLRAMPPPDPKEDPLPQEVCPGTYPGGVTPPASSYYPLHYPRAILTGSSSPSQPATSFPARLPLSFTRPALEVLLVWRRSRYRPRPSASRRLAVRVLVHPKEPFGESASVGVGSGLRHRRGAVQSALFGTRATSSSSLESNSLRTGE